MCFIIFLNIVIVKNEENTWCGDLVQRGLSPELRKTQCLCCVQSLAAAARLRYHEQQLHNLTFKMVKRCAWGTCKSDSRYPERIEGVHFIPFPKPKVNYEKCLLWIKLCGRPHSQLNPSTVTKHTPICSKVRLTQ